jgi:hypothetical protein
MDHWYANLASGDLVSRWCWGVTLALCCYSCSSTLPFSVRRAGLSSLLTRKRDSRRDVGCTRCGRKNRRLQLAETRRLGDGSAVALRTLMTHRPTAQRYTHQALHAAINNCSHPRRSWIVAFDSVVLFHVALFTCTCIHFNPRVLEWTKWNLV